jgi:type IV pilus assembly protein PilB
MITTVKLKHSLLGEILVRHGWVTTQQVDSALASQKKQGGYLGERLVEMGCLTQRQLVEALAEQRCEVPEISAADLFSLSPKVTKLLPEALARRFNALGLGRDEDGSLTVALENPGDLTALDLLSQITGCHVEAVKAQVEDITTAIDNFYGSQLGMGESKSGEQTLEEISLEVDTSEEQVDYQGSTSELAASAEETPVVRLVEGVFKEAVKRRASDIHLEAEEHSSMVRIRVDGVLQRLLTISNLMHPAVVSRIKILSGLDIAERRLPQDGRCRLKFPSREVDVRVSTLPTVHGEKLVMRLLDKTQSVKDLDSLGMGERDLLQFKNALQESYGMILLTGPTGSGKTSSLYAGLNYINDPSRNIVTVEDPVEYEQAGIGQVQIKSGIGLTFAASLRAILRQDPNVIMVGEMRDLETTQIAIRAALTGHLVLSTIHANNAPAVVSRLIDIGIPPYLITASLNLCIAQRLVRRLCTECKRPYEPGPELVKDLAGYEGVDQATFFQAVGCARCNHTGYRGRAGLYEVMVLSRKIKHLIQTDASERELRQVAREEGMRTLYEQGVYKAMAGVTSFEEVLSLPSDKDK